MKLNFQNLSVASGVNSPHIPDINPSKDLVCFLCLIVLCLHFYLTACVLPSESQGVLKM